MTMKMISHRLFSLSIIPIFIGIIFSIVPVANATTCMEIGADLSYGQTDQVSGGPIASLQRYLQSSSFLKSNPNGHFGQATLSAVKSFQTSVGISSTGYIGPKTRAYISKKTCDTTMVQPVPISTPIPVVTPVATVSNTNIISPATGQVLSVGSTTVIRWNNPVSGMININLEQPGGIGAGFIALSQVPALSNNQYIWNVGKVFSSQTNSSQFVSPGTYHIRLQSVNGGTDPSDQTSGWFTVLAQQFAASSVVPSSAYADDTTSVALFGTGFTASASIYFDSNYSSFRANNRYVSPDGTVLVFTIPMTVPTGLHTLFINNSQNSTPVTLPFTVNSIN